MLTHVPGSVPTVFPLCMVINDSFFSAETHDMYETCPDASWKYYSHKCYKQTVIRYCIRLTVITISQLF